MFGVNADAKRLEDGLLVVVEGDGQKVALFVDDLLGQQQVVIKSLETNFRRVEGLSGATILGDGTVALILDIAGLIHLSKIARIHPDPNDPDGSDKSSKNKDQSRTPDVPGSADEQESLIEAPSDDENTEAA